MSDKLFVCGNCIHWVKLPADPANLSASKGQCRYDLHLIALPTMNPITKEVMPSFMPVYAIVPYEFPNCSHWEHHNGNNTTTST